MFSVRGELNERRDSYSRPDLQASKTVIARWGYLGSYQLDVDYDLYLCQASKTVIARWGSEGPQYDSGLALITRDSVIAVAARRALAYYMGIRKYWEV